jgi:hypothetical protein
MVDRVQSGKSVDTKASPTAQHRPRIKVLRPVCLFREDVEKIVERLTQIGQVEVSTDKVHLVISGPERSVNCKKIWENRPVRWLWFWLRRDSAFLASIVVQPTYVEFGRAYDWNPSESEEDVLDEVDKLLCDRRHALFFLGERGQLISALAALLVVLVAGILVLLGVSHTALMMFSTVIAALAVAWIVIGWLLLPRSHLAIRPTTREESQRHVRRLVYYAIGALIIFTCGFAAGVLVATRR